METKTSTVLIDVSAQELLPWHKPEVTRLSVSLDTAAKPGSAIDGSVVGTPPL